jgi:hypothetical protein
VLIDDSLNIFWKIIKKKKKRKKEKKSKLAKHLEE